MILRVFSMIGCLALALPGLAQPAMAADAAMGDFYKSCLESKGQPVTIRANGGVGSYEGDKEAEISVTVSPDSVGKVTVSRNGTFSSGASGIIISQGSTITFTGTRAFIKLREGTNLDYCLRVRVL